MHPSSLLAALLCLVPVLSSPVAIPPHTPPPLQKRACSNPATHLEWRNLTNPQRTAYLQAEKCLFKQPAKSGLPGPTNLFEDIAAVHQNMTGIIHNVGQFLPWHRYMLHAHETLLRTECGYNGPMTWWDETRDAGNFEHAPLFTSEYFGACPPGNGNGPTCITDGVFANIQLSVGPGPAETTHCLSRAVDESLSAGQTSSFANQCNSNDNYTSMWECVFTGPHAYGHDSVGGVMDDVDTSPGDPVFYMHHGMIDRNWRAWQAVDPASRLNQLSGYTTQNCGSACQEVTPDYQLDIFNLIGGATIGDVMDTEGGYLCYQYDY